MLLVLPSDMKLGGGVQERTGAAARQEHGPSETHFFPHMYGDSDAQGANAMSAVWRSFEPR